MTDTPAIEVSGAMFNDAVDNCPALKALSSDRRRLFVLNHVFGADEDNHAEAARKAGYGKPDSSPLTMTKMARNLLVDPAIQAAVLEVGRRYLTSLVGKALRTCDEIMSDKTARNADRLRAAGAILDRTFGTTSTVQMQVDHFHHDIDHTKAAVDALRYLKGLKVPHEVLVEQFGHSGLARYERALSIEDEKSGKLIEGRVEAAN
jgi:hypothetical protein